MNGNPMIKESSLVNGQSGFTLLEVLLSGFILFLVLSSMTLIYRGALLTSGKAESTLALVAAVPSVRAIVSDQFREGARSGEGRQGGLRFRWNAELAYEGYPSSYLIQEDPSLRYFLWQIELTLDKDRVSRRYHFSEVAW
tara:strand:- start:226 stop:645 length:420 start_codon:yes stop_codon:yes gene_type:complete